jgi:transposase
MPNVRITLPGSTLEMLGEIPRRAQHRGDLRTIRRVNAVLADADAHSPRTIASILMVCGESIRLWVKAFMLEGPNGLVANKLPGRPVKLTKTQKQQLDAILTEGPSSAGFTGRFFCSAQEGRLTSETYAAFLRSVLANTHGNLIFVQDGARYHTSKQTPENTVPVGRGD